MAATTRLPALAARAAMYGEIASARSPRARPSGSASMSWTSFRRDRRAILTTRRALVRDGHTHSHSHGANEGEKPPANQAHAHSHGEHAHAHAHAHSHGGHSHSHSHSLGDESDVSDSTGESEDVSDTGWPRGSRPRPHVVDSTRKYAFKRNPPLKRGAGKGLCLFVDAFTAGVAGDMFVAAALDLGVPLDAVREQLAALSYSPGSPSPSPSPSFGGYSIDVVHDEKSCIVAPRFVVAEDGDVPQPMRDYKQIKSMLANAPLLRSGVRARALRCFAVLAEGEAEVHGMDVEDVHFHEVGAVDSVVDIVAACAAMEYLECSSVLISPLPMGRGVARGAAHGPLPSPPPAVLSCLCGSGLETFDAGADGEFVTPTGACIVAALGTEKKSTRWPASFAPLRTAYGAGTKSWRDRPNLLRLVLGASRSASSISGDANA